MALVNLHAMLDHVCNAIRNMYRRSEMAIDISPERYENRIYDNATEFEAQERLWRIFAV